MTACSQLPVRPVRVGKSLKKACRIANKLSEALCVCVCMAEFKNDFCYFAFAFAAGIGQKREKVECARGPFFVSFLLFSSFYFRFCCCHYLLLRMCCCVPLRLFEFAGNAFGASVLLALMHVAATCCAALL